MDPEVAKALVALKVDPAAAAKLEEGGKWDELAKMLESAVRASKRAGEELPIVAWLGTIYWKQLQAMDQAELQYRKVRKAEPTNRTAIDFYREYHLGRNELPQLLAMLTQVQKAEPDADARLRLGIEMAELAESRPQSLEKAIDLWKALLKQSPGLPDAVKALRRLYMKGEKWNALLELLKEELERLPAERVDDKVALYLEMVPIYRDRMKLDVMVSNMYASILTLKPDHAEALSSLASWHEAKGRWNDLVQILQRSADVAGERGDADEQARLLHKIAAVWSDKLGKPQNAAAALERVVALKPHDAEADAALTQLYTKTRAWKSLLDLQRKRLPSLAPEARVARLAEMARLAHDKMGETKLAIGLWNEVLELDPEHDEALAALVPLYEADKRPAAVAEMLARQAARATDQATKVALLERRGLLLADKLGAVEAAIADLRVVEEAQPDNARVLRALRELYAKVGDWDGLEALYVRRKDFEELYEAFGELADKQTDPAIRGKLLARAAEVATNELGQPERAIKAHERILLAEPTNRQAAKVLADLYRRSERWNRLLATLEILLGAELAADERRAILDEGRKVAEEKLGSKALAFQWSVRTWEASAGEDDGVLADVERLAREADEWDALAALYRKRLDGGVTGAARIELLRKALTVAQGRLGRRDEAKGLALELVKLVPGDEGAENALKEIYTAEERWPDLLALLRGRAERTPEVAAKVERLVSIARLEEEKLRDQAAAAKTLRAALEVDPQNKKLLAALARLSEALGDDRALADVLRRQVVLAGANEQVALLLRVGALSERQGAWDEARDAFAEALEADPVSAEAVAGLERLLDANRVPKAQIPALAARLARFYEVEEQFKRWAWALDLQVQGAASEAERRALLETLSDLQAGPIGDAAAAFHATLEVFALAPSDAQVRERLIERARAAGKVDELVTAFRDELAGTTEVVLRRDLLSHIAELESGRAERAKEAEAAWREILAIDPLHGAAYKALSRVLQESERWGDLRTLLDERAGLIGTPKERVALLAQIAELDETILSDLDHAVVTHQRLLEAEPGAKKSFEALERLLTKLERWRDLEALYARQATLPGLATKPEGLALRQKRAEVLLDKLASPAEALEVVEVLVKDVPKGDPRGDDVRRILEQLAQRPETEARASALLEPIYEAGSDWAKLVKVLETSARGASASDLPSLLARIASIQEHKLEARAAALETWKRLLFVEGGEEDALPEYERLATLLERDKELIETYEALAARKDAVDVAGKAELLVRAARVARDQLTDRDRAIEIQRAILALDPDNLDTARPAALAIEDLYEEGGNHRGLVDILRMRAGWTDDAAARTALYLRVAVIEEEALGQLEAAASTLRTVLEQEPEHAGAIARLERILAVTSRHRDRVDVLARRVSAATDATSRNALRWQIVRILESDLGDLDGAIETVREIADDDPASLAPLDALERLYGRKEAHSDRLEILERSLALATDDADRVEILLRMGELLAGPLARPVEALERWRAILDIVPGEARAVASLELLLDEERAVRLEAAACLEPAFEAGRDWKRLARVIGVYAAEEEDRHERLKHRLRLASLLEEKLGNPFEAQAVYALSLRDAIGEPEMGPLLDAFERLSAQIGKSGEVLALYKQIEPDLLNEAIRLRVQRTIAIESARAGDRDTSAATFKRILEQIPDDNLALTALDRLYRKQNDKESLFGIVLRRAEVAAAKAPAQELALRLEAGAIAVELGRPDEAIAEYERALALEPTAAQAAPATAALAKLYETAERWPDLVDLLSRQLDRGVEGAEALALHERLAHLLAEQLLERERALAHLSFILSVEPGHAGALAMLESFLQHPEIAAAAADLIEPVYVRGSQWAKLVELDELRRNQIETPERRIVWTRRIARIYEEQVEDLDKAFEWYGKVFTEAPSDEEVRDQLLRLAPKLNRWKDLADLFASYLEDELGDAPAVLEIVRLCATLYDEQVGDRDAARKQYQRYVEAKAHDAEAVRLYEHALERWGAHAELRELLEEQATRAESTDARVTLLRRSARLAEEKLDDRERAVSTLRALLDEKPGDREANRELERLLTVDQRWSDLADHLMAVAERETDPNARLEATFRLGVLQEERLENRESAVDRYGEILTESAEHAGARQRLERLLDDADLRDRAARLLEPVYRGRKAYAELVRVLEIMLESTDSAGERITVLRDIAATEQRLGRLDRVLEARGRAFLEDATDAQSLAELEAAAQAVRGWSRLVELYAEGARSAGDPDVQAAVWGKAAAVYELGLGDATSAIEAWRAALEARPDLEDAFVALERLLTAGNLHQELVETLEKHLDVATDEVSRKALARKAATIYEEVLENRDRAITAWKGVLDIDDTDEAALDALVRLHAAAESWRDLSDVYLRKVELARDAASLRALRFQLAALYDERLADPSEAVTQLRAVLDDRPGDHDALVALDRIFSREGQHAELLEVLDQRIRVETNALERDALALRAARLVEHDIGDVSDALSRYREILERAPRDAGARSAVWDLARAEGGPRSEAVAVLEPVLRKGAEWPELIELLEIKAATADSPGERVSVLAEVARLEEERRNDGARAFHAWARAFAEDPHDGDARTALERLAKTQRAEAKLAEVYEERVGATYDVELQRTLLLRLADLYDGALGDPDRALASLRTAAEIPGDEGPILARLEAQLAKLGRDAELADVLARQAEVANDVAEQARHLATLGAVRAGKLDDRRGAVEAFRGALERVPTLEPALEALRELVEDPDLRADVIDVLEPLAEQRGDAAELVRLYELRADGETDGDVRAAWRRRAAEALESRVGDRAGALRLYAKALEEEPSSEEGAGELERVAEAAGLLEEGARAFETAMAKTEGRIAGELALKAARLWEALVPRAGTSAGERAETLYLKVLEEDAESQPALEALERLYRAREGRDASSKLARILERRATATFDPSERTNLLLEAARLLEKAGDTAGAIASYEATRQAEEGQADALAALARIYERDKRAGELAAVLEEQARFTDASDDRATLWVRVGTIRLDDLGDLDAAAAAFREAMDAVPNHPPALEALAALEIRRGDFSAYEEVLLQQLAATDEAAGQVEILFRLAENAREKIEDRDRAAGYLRQVLDADAGNRRAYAELEALLAASERWHDLNDLLEQRAARELADGKAAEARRCRLAIADIWLRHLDSPDTAREVLGEVLAKDPLFVPALLSLAELEEREGNRDEAVALLGKASTAATSARDASDIEFRMGRLLAERGAPAEEIEARYVAALERDSSHRGAIAELEKAARAESNHGRLVQLLELKERIAETPAERKALLAEIGSLYIGPLEMPAEAVVSLEALAQLAPDDVESQELLGRALVGAGRRDEGERVLLGVLERLQAAKQAKAVARVQQVLGSVAEERGELSKAAERFQAAYQIDPTQPVVLASLARLAEAQRDVEKAKRFYRSLLLQTFDEKQIRVSKADIYMALGKLHLESGEVPKARNMLERGLEAAPGRDDIKQLLAGLPR